MKTPAAFSHFIEALEASAARFAEKPALQFMADGLSISERATFASLKQEAQTLAAQLSRRYPPGERVLLMLDNSIDYVRAFLGCLYSGVIAVPLYPLISRRPRHIDRVQGVLANAEPSLILCEAGGADLLRETGMISGDKIMTVAQLGAEGSGEGSGFWRQPRIEGDTVAFLQYTSGSTGAPKGVVVRHRNLVANLKAMQRAFAFTDQDHVVSWLPLFHDMGLIGAVLESLYSGMTCNLMTPKTFLDTPSVWLKALSHYQATASFAPNLAYNLCTRIADDALVAELNLSRWRHALNGAEPIQPSTITNFCKRFAPAGFRPEAFRPGFGQAEATLCVSATSPTAQPITLSVTKTALERGEVELVADTSEAVELVACGTPMDEHQVLIVNPDTRRRSAAHEVGEIWLSGPSNADSYWRNEAASNESLRAQIIGEPTDEERYVRSGDLGFLYQGQLVICGRLKDLIIINGRNIYPPDLEFAITDAEPAIRAGRLAAFSVWDAGLGREKVVIMAELRRPTPEEALYAGMRQAAYEAADCVLDEIVLVEPNAIPTTTSGKISRQGARQLYLQSALSSSRSISSSIAPLTASELRARIEQGQPASEAYLEYLQYQLRRLGHSAANAERSLLQLGLDSLAISALRVNIEHELGWSPALSTLFGEETLGELSARWALQQAADKPAALIFEHSQGEPAPLSYAQQRLWFLHELEPLNPQHNIVIHLTLRGPLNRDFLEKSLSSLIERHATLRTSYQSGTVGAEQRIASHVSFSLTYHDLAAQPSEQQRAQVEDGIAAERAAPFDLKTPPLLRARLYACAPDAHALVLCVHHIAFDGRSAEIFLDELGLLYQALRRGDAPILPTLTLQYSDFARWERSYFGTDSRQTQLDFWRAYLGDIPTTLSLGAPPITTPRAQKHSFIIERDVCHALQRYSRESGLTLFMTLLTLYGVLLRYISNQERFLLGTDVSGRWRPETESMLGFFINQLVLRCDHREAPTLRALFARQRSDAQLAYAHQELPFDLLVSALAPSRSPQQAPLFQAKLNYQPDRAEACTLDDVRAEQTQVYQEAGAFALVLDLVHGREGITAALSFDVGAFGPLFGARVQGLWGSLLREFNAWLERPLSELLRQLKQWDGAVQLQLGQSLAAESRAQLGQIKRQPKNQ